MAETGIFISSCSRREWARRRPGRSMGVLPLLLVAAALAIVLVALLLSGGGIV
jgi:hypothetical protein